MRESEVVRRGSAPPSFGSIKIVYVEDELLFLPPTYKIVTMEVL